MDETTDKIVLRYIGEALGYYVEGVPRRDLTGDDLERLPGNWTTERLVESGSYAMAEGAIAPKAKRAPKSANG